MDKIAVLVNNTREDLRDFYPAIKQALESTGKMPDELADLFSVQLRMVNGELRAIIGWA